MSSLALISTMQAQATHVPTALKTLVSRPTDFHNAVVTTVGKIDSVELDAQLRSGMPTWRAMLAANGVRVAIVTTLGPTLGKGDSVRITGKFTHYEPSATTPEPPNEIDISNGDAVVLSRREDSRDDAVPIRAVETPLSRADAIASVVSALFAVLATGSLLLHRRRFNIGLEIMQPKLHEATPAGDNVRLAIDVRVVSTKSISPQLSSDIRLSAGGQDFLPETVLNALTQSTMEFPVAVAGQTVLRLYFLFPGALARTLESQVRLTFRDAFSRRIFGVTQPLQIDRDVRVLRAKGEGRPIAVISRNQLVQLLAELKSQPQTDRSIWLDASGIAALKTNGTEPAVVEALEHALGSNSRCEIAWTSV